MAARLEDLLPLLARLAGADGEPARLADLAAADGRSPSHLQRVFRAEVGESPLQFSRRVRLQRAAAALLMTRKSVLDVALDAGFESPEGFSRAFKARFELSPRAFRALRGRFQPPRRQPVHLETAQRAAPCVGLYRVSLAQLPRQATFEGGSGMSYEITKRQSTETPFLYIWRQVKPEGIAEALGNIFPTVFQYVTAQGIPLAGRPTARFVGYGPGLVTIEAGMPIEGAAEGHGEIQLGSLVGGDLVTTRHRGPYDRLNQAHEAIQRWLVDNGEEPNGAPWEVYVTDPGELPDPADWLTEVNWPIEGSKTS